MGILDTDKTLASNQMVFDLRRNADLYAVFQQDLEAVMAQYALSDAEKQAWRNIDIEALGKMGVHPYFLPQISRLFRGGSRNHNSSDAALLYAEKMGIAHQE